MAKQTMSFEFNNMAFKKVWQVVANKKPLLTQNLTSHEFKFSIKKAYFLKLKNFVSQATTKGIRCLLYLKVNVLKIK